MIKRLSYSNKRTDATDCEKRSWAAGTCEGGDMKCGVPVIVSDVNVGPRHDQLHSKRRWCQHAAEAIASTPSCPCAPAPCALPLPSPSLGLHDCIGNEPELLSSSGLGGRPAIGSSPVSPPLLMERQRAPPKFHATVNGNGRNVASMETQRKKTAFPCALTA